MKLLDLPAGTVILDEYDFERLAGRSIYIGSNGYAYFSTWKDGPTTVHSFVMGGSRPGKHIDHVNGDRLDNRRSNLRYVSAQLNQVNRKRLSKANTSGARGVSRTSRSTRNPWRAQITVNGKNIHLGLHPTQAAAIEARRAAERQHYGEECPRV